MKNACIIIAVVITVMFTARQGYGQEQSSLSLKSDERGSMWVSHKLSVDAVPLNTGMQIALSVEYSVRTSAGMCEVLLERVQVPDRSMIQGAILGESFYKHIYTAIARHHAGSGEYPYLPGIADVPSTEPTHVFKRGMMMSWVQVESSRVVSVEPNPTAALCASFYSFALDNNDVKVTHHRIVYNVTNMPEPSLSEAR